MNVAPVSRVEESPGLDADRLVFDGQTLQLLCRDGRDHMTRGQLAKHGGLLISRMELD